MAGHSKWANIKHRKGRQDAKRGKLFAKLIRAIEAAARTGGGDLAANATLATAIQKAKDTSVPKDNIERAVARGSGDVDGVDYEEFFYEGYAPGGVALYVHDPDRQPQSGRIRRALRVQQERRQPRRAGLGRLSVRAEGLSSSPSGDEDTVMMAALEGGAEDVTASDDQWEIVCGPRRPRRGAGSARGGGRHDRPSRGHPDAVGTSVPVDAATAPKVLRIGRCPRGPRRRPGRLRQLRHPGRGPRRGRLTAPCRPSTGRSPADIRARSLPLSRSPPTLHRTYVRSWNRPGPLHHRLRQSSKPAATRPGGRRRGDPHRPGQADGGTARRAPCAICRDHRRVPTGRGRHRAGLRQPQPADRHVALAGLPGSSCCRWPRPAIPVEEYTPSAVKMALTGYGNADKDQIRQGRRRCGWVFPARPAGRCRRCSGDCAVSPAGCSACVAPWSGPTMIGRLTGRTGGKARTSACRARCRRRRLRDRRHPRALVELPAVGEEAVLHTHLHVREDQLALFGFPDEDQRDLFRILLGVSGVGPKVALAILGT